MPLNRFELFSISICRSPFLKWPFVEVAQNTFIPHRSPTLWFERTSYFIGSNWNEPFYLPRRWPYCRYTVYSLMSWSTQRTGPGIAESEPLFDALQTADTDSTKLPVLQVSSAGSQNRYLIMVRANIISDRISLELQRMRTWIILHRVCPDISRTSLRRGWDMSVCGQRKPMSRSWSGHVPADESDTVFNIHMYTKQIVDYIVMTVVWYQHSKGRVLLISGNV